MSECGGGGWVPFQEPGESGGGGKTYSAKWVLILFWLLIAFTIVSMIAS